VVLDLTAWDDGFDALSRHLPWDCFVWPGVVLLEEDASLMAVVEYHGRDQDGMEPAEIQQVTQAVANVLFPFTGGWTFHVEPFRRLMVQLAALLGRAVGWAKLLDDDEVQTFLHACVSPVRQAHVAAPDIPGFPLKAALVDTGFVPGSFPAWSNGGDAPWHLRVLSLGGYPSASHPGLLNALDKLPFELRWSVRFEAMDHVQAKGVFAALWRKHDDTSYDWRSVLLRAVGGFQALRHDPVGVMEALEAEAAGTSSGWMTPTAVVWARGLGEVEDRRDELAKCLRGLGFIVIEEGWGAERAWYGTLPGHVRPNPRKVPLTQTSLADFLVLSSAWGGPERNEHLRCDPLMQLEAEGGAPLMLDLHQGQDGSALVVGPPRTGKSTVLAVLGHQFLARVPGGRVIWIDVDAQESTSLVATWAAGGRFLAMGGEGGVELALQPLADVDTASGFAWGHGFVLDLLRVQGLLDRASVPAAELGDVVATALRLLSASPPAERTLSHLAHLAQANAVRTALEPWCRGGPYGDLVDAATDHLEASPWTTVDIGQLIDRGPMAAPVVRALFRRFFRLFEDSRPTLFLVDEAFKALKHRPDELEEIRRRGPKKNVSLVLATHLLDDIEGSPIAAMLRTIQVLILLADPNAAKRAIFKDYGLNATQALQVARAMPRRDVFYKTPQGSRLGRLELDPAALAVCSCGGAAMRRQAHAVMRRAGPARFAAAWLAKRGGLVKEAEALGFRESGSAAGPGPVTEEDPA
jgi:type IV secretion system protein VirB4